MGRVVTLLVRVGAAWTVVSTGAALVVGRALRIFDHTPMPRS